VIADGYPLLETLKRVHVLLPQGSHNQFGDLPWTARAEMLQQQWILARPEVNDFLNGQEAVSYEEAWMPQVDVMKTLQGWSQVSITHFRMLRRDVRDQPIHGGAISFGPPETRTGGVECVSMKLKTHDPFSALTDGFALGLRRLQRE